ncbi:MAG: hypothetical protein EPN74_01955 [Rhodanobacter sp.]|nr:MAG: hypothetical protein EPN74_01955 [Rhodanobacter sp.]
MTTPEFEDPRLRDTSGLWLEPLRLAIPDLDLRETHQWHAPRQIAHILTALAKSGATTACIGSSTFSLIGVDTSGQNDGLLELDLDDQRVQVRLQHLDFVPHPHNDTHSVFVLTCGPLVDDPGYRIVFAHETGVAIPMVTTMGRSSDPQDLQRDFASRAVQREGAGPVDGPADASLNDPIVKAYAEHRQGRSGPLEQNDIDVIAWAALVNRQQPTLELIRRVAGGGSNTSIHPKLKHFYATLVEQHLQEIDVDPGLLHVWNQLTDRVTREGEARLGPQLDQLTVREEALSVGTSRLRAAEVELASERDALHAADQARQAFVGHLEKQLASSSEQLVAAHHTIAGDADQLAQYRTELTHARQQVVAGREEIARRDVDLTRSREQLNSASAQHQASLHQIESLNAKVIEAATHADKLTMDLEHLKASSRTTIDNLQARIVQAEAVLTAERAASVAERQRADALQMAINGLNEELGALRAIQEQRKVDLVRATEIAKSLPALQEQLTVARVELRLITEERDRLRLPIAQEPANTQAS